MGFLRAGAADYGAGRKARDPTRMGFPQFLENT